MLTVITQTFGVRGEGGDLVIEPKLVREQFDENGTASLTLPFGGRELQITFINRNGKDFGQYLVEKACLGAQALTVVDGRAVLEREKLLELPEQGSEIVIELM